MIYTNIRPATFLERPNRFTARVLADGRTVTCHVKNTGRCRELLIPGADVLIQFHPDAKAAGRKTEFSLIAVWKNGRLVNMDSQAPNQAAWEWLSSAPELTDLRREVTFGNSRFDLAFEHQGHSGFLEVKGVTLEENGVARFPDAPTLRGVKHIRELQRAAADGLDATLFFVIQIEDIASVAPNDATQPDFGSALRDAAAHGVRVLAYDCDVAPDCLKIRREVPVIL